MNVKKKPLVQLLMVMAVLISSCQSWGEWDEPSGNQKNPPPEPPIDTSAKLLAKYTFENSLKNELDGSVSGEAMAQTSGKLPSFEASQERGGTVLHQYFGYNDAASMSYARFANPLQGIDELYGASISLWIKRTDDNIWDTVWSFFDEDPSDGIDGRFYFTPNAYLGFNGTGGWFDCNHPDAVTQAIPVGEWAMVTVSIDMTGFVIYLNGKSVYSVDEQLAWNAIDGLTPAKFSYQHVINLLKSSPYFYLGYGSWWGSAELLIDDLLLYKGALTASEVSALYDSYSGLVAYYNFDNNLKNVVNESESGELLAQASGMLPSFESGEGRPGNYLHQYFGHSGASSTSYARFNNPLKGKEITGATISIWTNRKDANVWDAIWSFLDEDNSDGIEGRVYLTPNAYLGFNGTGGWFDCNFPDYVTNSIAVNEWNMVSLTLDVTGFAIYINGIRKYDKTQQLAWNADGIAAADFNYEHVINLLKSADNFYLGYGSWWGSADLLLDDLMIYNRSLSNTEIAKLYESSK